MHLALRSCLLLVFVACTARLAWAQEGLSCDTLLVQAEASFFDGDFEETVRLLAPCTAPNAPQPVSIAAYRLVSMAYMNSGDTQSARQTITTLLLENPAYEADPIQDPPAYAVLVSVMREQLQAEGRLPTRSAAVETRPRRLLSYLGATIGLLAVGVAAYLVGEPVF